MQSFCLCSFFVILSTFLTPSLFVVVPCPKCNHDKAAYTEFQTRSADEPATIFYLCLNEKCRHQWRDWLHTYAIFIYFHGPKIGKLFKLFLIGIIWQIRGFLDFFIFFPLIITRMTRYFLFSHQRQICFKDW